MPIKITKTYTTYGTTAQTYISLFVTDRRSFGANNTVKFSATIFIHFSIFMIYHTKVFWYSLGKVYVLFYCFSTNQSYKVKISKKKPSFPFITASMKYDEQESRWLNNYFFLILLDTIYCKQEQGMRTYFKSHL